MINLPRREENLETQRKRGNGGKWKRGKIAEIAVIADIARDRKAKASISKIISPAGGIAHHRGNALLLFRSFGLRHRAVLDQNLFHLIVIRLVESSFTVKIADVGIGPGFEERLDDGRGSDD